LDIVVAVAEQLKEFATLIALAWSTVLVDIGDSLLTAALTRLELLRLLLLGVVLLVDVSVAKFGCILFQKLTILI
jgi:hypothetical protein